MAEKLRGSCLCGGVRYEIEGPIGAATHCHCSMCRKQHGAAFATYGRVAWESFRWTDGDALVTAFESSPETFRSFCRRCGASLQWYEAGDPCFGLAWGTLDDDPGTRPIMHIHADDAAPWYEIADGLPQHASMPEAEGS